MKAKAPSVGIGKSFINSATLGLVGSVMGIALWCFWNFMLRNIGSKGLVGGCVNTPNNSS